MADSTKIFKIQINGLTESISAVDALNKQLEKLEQRMNKVSSAKVSTGGGSTRGGNSALSQEEAVQKEINKLKEEGQKLDAKIAASQDEIYKRVDATKQIYKEVIADQKSLAAQERLTADAYSKTMVGMKQQLADLKAVIQTTDLGDSDQIKKMTKQANELTKKLKEMEEAYGQFGRNVGNYKSVFDQVKQVTVTIGNTQRTFNSVRDASRQLTQELKAMAIAGKEGTKEYEELSEALHNFEMASKRAESAVNDLKASSKGMDDVLDTFQSLAALGQIGQGFSAFFGFDDTEIQRSIQKLVALQNVMQGIEKIRQQMNTQEGFGSLFSKGSASIDRFVAKLTGAKVTMDGLTMSSRAATTAVRGLSLALKAIGVGVAMYGINLVISMFEKFKTEADTTTKKLGLSDESLKSINKRYEERRDLMTSSYMRGEMSNEDFLTNQYRLQADYIAKQVNLLKERMAIMNEQQSSWFSESTTTYGGGRMNDEVSVKSYNNFLSFENSTLEITAKNIEEVEKAWRKCNEAINEGKDYFSKWGEGVVDWLNSLITTVGDTERVMRELGKVEIGNFVGTFGEVNEQFKKGEISAEQFAAELAKLKKELNNNDVLRSVLVNLDKYIPDEGVREAINNIINDVIRLDDSFNMTSPEQIRHWTQVRIDAMKQGQDKIKAQIDADEKYEIATYGKTQEQINLIHAKYERKRLEETEKYNEQARNKAKQHARELENILKEYNALRIELMDEGLEKQLAKLNEEKRQRVKKAKEDGIDTSLVEKLYDKKILEARKNWAYNVEQVYTDMWNKIYQINHNNAQSNFDLIEKEIKAEYDKLQDLAASKYGDVYLGYSEKNRVIETRENGRAKVSTETDEAYTKRLAEEYQKRKDLVTSYYSETQRILTEEENKLYANSIKKLEEAKNNELRTLINSYSAQDHEIQEHYRKGEITLEQYNEVVKRLEKERGEQEIQIQLKYQRQAEDNEREHNQKLLSYSQDTDDAIVDHFRKSMEALSKINTSEEILNKLGLLNISAVKRRNNQVVALYKQMAVDIENSIRQLEIKMQSSDLTKETTKRLKETIAQLKQLLAQAGAAIEETEADTDESWSKFIGKLSYYVSQVGSALSSLVGALGDYADQQYENTINDLEKQIDAQRDIYQKQEELVNEHKNRLNEIENELSTARGDRRQRLIDELNAEMAAQRQALAEQKKAEKEQKRLEDKKDKEEKKRLEAQKKQQRTQAVINGAVGVTNALATPPIWLGIALASVMAAATAVQIATIDSQKYAEGGVIQGEPHSRGGVKVLGGQAEVEGNEFIVNKRTTQAGNNTELLYYINSKKRKLNLSDFIEFYSGEGTRRNITSMTKPKYAEGGQLPTLRGDIDVNSRLLAAFEDYSNRPVVVAVTEINERQAAVKNVRVLAGLEE